MEKNSKNKKKEDTAPVQEQQMLAEACSDIPPKLTVVIPYRKEKAQGEELRYAMRSWDKHFLNADKINMVVIGDKEDWMDEGNITVIPYDNPFDNPQQNMAEIIKIAVASDKVSDCFILSNDDIYLWNTVSLAHVAVPKYTGLLNPEQHKGIYQKNMIRTMQMLKDAGFSPLNYATHTPFYLSKEKIVETFERFPALSDGALFSCLYFALVPETPVPIDWQHDNWHVSVVSPNPSQDKFEKYVPHKCFVNNSVAGYSPFFEKKLAEHFPDKSVFEK